MKIYAPFAAQKTKPNKAKTNPILAQNWLCFSQYWLCSIRKSSHLRTILIASLTYKIRMLCILVDEGFIV